MVFCVFIHTQTTFHMHLQNHSYFDRRKNLNTSNRGFAQRGTQSYALDVALLPGFFFLQRGMLLF